MKKKNLIILLLLPFIIAVLCIFTVNFTYNAVDVDISAIAWDYDDLTPFQLKDGQSYKLIANGVNRNNYKLAEGNELVWSVSNKDGSTEPYAEIVQEGGEFFLKPLKEGDVIITCSTQKGNVSRQFTGVIYENAVLMVQPVITGSQLNIDSTVYYGEYDLKNNVKQPATIDLKITALPTAILNQMQITTSDNVSYESYTQTSGKLTINGTGDAHITLSCDIAKDGKFEFNVVEEGVNVYTYQDLLYCTNDSEQGEIVVLRKHFESVENAYDIIGTTLKPKANNVECFGTYDPKTKTFNFAKELYNFTTTYNKNYIDGWEDFCKTNPKYDKISDQVLVGLRVQKDFYGNGYTINMHNLTFPYLLMSEDPEYYDYSSDNLFKGPLPFYTLGDPNDTPLVSALGQDNICMYVDGNNITVNHLQIMSCDYGDNLDYLDRAGTVIDIYGNNNVIKNSIIKNGRNVVRAFSSQNLTIQNCLISSSRNFLFTTGANEYAPLDEKTVSVFYDESGASYTSTIKDALAKDGVADNLLNNYLLNDFSSDAIKKANIEKAILAIQNALNSVKDIKNDFKGSTEIVDCFFENSGIAAISVESMFNGPYLYNASPTFISSTFEKFSFEGKQLVPYTAVNFAGISYPVKVNISGKSAFYDYKTRDEIILDGLITENISLVANSITSGSYQITIDDIFPLKGIIFQRANLNKCIHMHEGKQYINIPVAFYGGGVNLSQVTFSGLYGNSNYSQKIEVDLLNTYLGLSGGTGKLDVNNLRNIMLKTVPTVIGYEPFNFYFIKNGYKYNETAKISDLMANAKGE